MLNRKTVTNVVLTLAFVLLPQLASAQTNTFPTSGNAGIGTTSPGDALQIVKDNGGLTLDTATSGTIVPVFRFSTTGTGRASIQYRPDLPGLAFQTGGIAYPAQNRMVLTDSGKVGIGTSAPSEILHVGGGFLSTIRNEMSTWLSQNVPGGETDWSHNAYYSSGWKYRLADEASQIQQLNGDIRFFTAGSGTAGSVVTFSEKLTVLQGGNVGIGTASPKTKFDIKQSEDTFVGGLHLRRSSTNDTWALATGTDNSLYMGYANNASGADAGSDFTVYPLVLTGSGKVGIGSANPGYKLDVQGGQINSSGGLCIAGDCKTAWSQVGGGGSSQWTGTSSIYYNVGNVGIGTTSPDHPLTVKASGSTTQGFAVKNNALSQYLGYVGPRGSGGTAQNQGYVGVFDQGTTTIALDSAGSSYFNGGNVGIGTSNPSDLLDVNSTTGWGFRVRYAGDGQYLRVSANQLSAFTAAGTPKDLYLNTDGGNVGIGNASPTEKLHVTGNGKFTGNLTVDGTINAKYQDVAEWVPTSEQLSAGMVVVLDQTKSNQVISSTVSYDTRVAGVISERPGITLGESGEGKVLVATTGRVRVKVDATRAPIQIGDLLVTSDVTGVAMKSVPIELGGRKMHMPGTLIGKALEPLAKGKGEILVLLSLQ